MPKVKIIVGKLVNGAHSCVCKVFKIFGGMVLRFDRRTLFANVLSLVAVIIVIYQSYLWLQTGVWANISVGSAVSYESEDVANASWKGLAIVLGWLLAVPLILPFALSGCGIFAADAWKRFNAHRPLKSEGLAILAATWLAAIAAGLSSVAAFRQEKATFTNSLYTKQVDTFGSLLAKADNVSQYLHELNGSTQHNSEERVKTFLNEDIAKFFFRVREVNKTIGPLIDDFDQTENQVLLVTPEPMRQQVFRLKQKVDNFRNETKAIGDFLEKERMALDRKTYPSNLNPVFRDFSRKIAYTDSTLVDLQLEIRNCAFNLFVEGRFLSESALRECKLTRPPKPD
jgi:hypothetical protein